MTACRQSLRRTEKAVPRRARLSAVDTERRKDEATVMDTVSALP